MSTSVEIIFAADGTILIPQGTSLQNSIIRDVVGELTDSTDEIHDFLAMSENIELIFGDSTLCG